MPETKHRRYDTDHNDLPFASSALEARLGAATLAGGGILLWDLATFTFSWTETLYIHFPTIGGDSIQIAPGSVGGILALRSFSVEVPYRSTDDVDPAGAWVVGDILYTDADVLVSFPADESEPNFILGVHAADNRLYLRDGTVLADGYPTVLGYGSSVGSRYYTLADGGVAGGVYDDIGWTYLPGLRQIDVYANGILQHPYHVDAAGYTNVLLDGQYIEVQGAAVLPNYSGIEWINGHEPLLSETVVVVARTGAPGPQGAAGGLNASYLAGNEITVVGLAGPPVAQIPIELQESDDMVLDPGPPIELLAGHAPHGIQFNRVLTHPNVPGEPSLVLLTSGDVGLGSIFYYNQMNYTSLLGEMSFNPPGTADYGLYYQGMEFGSGAENPRSKIIIAFVPQHVLSAELGGDIDVGFLPEVRQSECFKPQMEADKLYGQFAVNKHGEIASCWGRDFLHWYTFDIYFPPTPFTVDYVDYTINSSVIPSTPGRSPATFLGGLATMPRDSVSRDTFFHVNPSLNYVGDNPYELKLTLNTDTGVVPWVRTLEVQYGQFLGGMEGRVTLFFSCEYAVGPDSPDEGEFSGGGGGGFMP